MSDFERNYQIDPSREQNVQIADLSIELSDLEFLKRSRKHIIFEDESPKETQEMFKEDYLLRQIVASTAVSEEFIKNQPDCALLSRDMQAAGFVYKPPVESEMTGVLKNKFDLAKKISQETKICNTGELSDPECLNEFVPTCHNLGNILGKKLENQEINLVNEVIENAKSKSKRSKKANKNVSSKPHTSAVARVQKKV